MSQKAPLYGEPTSLTEQALAAIEETYRRLRDGQHPNPTAAAESLASSVPLLVAEVRRYQAILKLLPLADVVAAAAKAGIKLQHPDSRKPLWKA